MVQQDTVRLLRECDAGVKMGISSIDDVLKYTSDGELSAILSRSKDEHSRLDSEIRGALERFSDEGKEPAVMAKSMSWLKTNVKLIIDESDETIADLITDGCNMGVKSLTGYLNKYKAADEDSKNIAKRLIGLEVKLCDDMKPYL